MLKLRPETVSGKAQPSFIGFRQQSAGCRATTRLRFTVKSPNEKANLLLFQNETHHFFFCISVDAGKPPKVNIEGNKITFSYNTSNGEQWEKLASIGDGKFLSTHTARGFVGTMVGLYATSNSLPSNHKVSFESVSYQYH